MPIHNYYNTLFSEKNQVILQQTEELPQNMFIQWGFQCAGGVDGYLYQLHVQNTLSLASLYLNGLLSRRIAAGCKEGLNQ